MTRKLTMLMLLITAALSARAADPIDEVRHAEMAFAKAFADRDQAKFFSMVLDDATFMGYRTLAGKSKVVERWSKFFADPVAPFSWGPERVGVNAAGTIGLSTGPVFDPKGQHIGNFASVWLKQPDGSWKILFDGPGSSPATLPGSELKIEEGFVTADDGAKLHYRKVGEGPVTLIVPLEFVVFDDFKQLADIATVIAYDLRNRGRSEHLKDLSSVTIQQDVKDLEAVRRHLKVDKFVPVGYSYLGLMVALYALDHPDHVAKIIQLGPVPMKFGTEYPKHLTNSYADMGIADADVKKWREMQAQGMAEKSPREFCDVDMKVMQYLLVGDPAHASRIKSWCDLENEWPVNLERHFKSSIESVKNVNVTKEQLQKITVPVLTIHGTKDRNAPYGSGREWAMTLPDARLVTVEGGAHQSWADDPVTVFASIREFLRGGWPLGSEKVTKLDPKM